MSLKVITKVLWATRNFYHNFNLSQIITDKYFSVIAMSFLCAEKRNCKLNELFDTKKLFSTTINDTQLDCFLEKNCLEFVLQMRQKMKLK